MHTLNKYLFLCCFLITQLTFAQSEITVPEKQIPLLSKVSASWCPYCGTWGWDFMEALMDDNTGSSNIVTLHYSGDYRSQEAAEMTSNFGAFGQPQFFLNSTRVNVNSSTVDAARSEVKATVSQSGTASPEAQTGILAGPTNGQLNIVTKTRFFQEVSGEYYLSLYILEKSFNGPQAGRNGNSLHKNVLRFGLTDNTFGEPIATGTISAGSEVIFQKSIDLSDMTYSLENIRILSIIWKKEGNKYLVVNSNSSEQFTAGVTLLPTADRRLGKADFQFSIQPNVVSNFALLKLILPSQRKNFQAELWTLNGKKVQDIFQGQLSSGAHEWTIDRSKVEAAGMYVLRLNDGSGQMSRRVIFR